MAIVTEINLSIGEYNSDGYNDCNWQNKTLTEVLQNVNPDTETIWFTNDMNELANVGTFKAEMVEHLPKLRFLIFGNQIMIDEFVDSLPKSIEGVCLNSFDTNWRFTEDDLPNLKYLRVGLEYDVKFTVPKTVEWLEFVYYDDLPQPVGNVCLTIPEGSRLKRYETWASAIDDSTMSDFFLKDFFLKSK